MKLLRKIFIGIAGGTVLVAGIIMIALPGPAILVIPAGLAILAIEFAWARNLLHKMKDYLAKRKAAKEAKRSERQKALFPSAASSAVPTVVVLPEKPQGLPRVGNDL